jgi:hypothetical protein
MPKKPKGDILANAAFHPRHLFLMVNGGANMTIKPANSTPATYGEPAAVTASFPFRQVNRLPTPIFIGGGRFQGYDHAW